MMQFYSAGVIRLLASLRAGCYFAFSCLLLSMVTISSAQALSSACSALNAASPMSSGTLRYQATEFDSGESLTVSYTDSGAGIGGDPTVADAVILASYSVASSYSRYSSDGGTAGLHTADVTSSQLKSGGLFFRVSTSNGYIGPVTVRCSAAAPTLSSDADLSGLSLSSGELSPAFSAATTHYTASVANNVSSLTVTPHLSNSAASMTVNGVAVSSGSSSSIGLSEGTNTITVIVTAEDGMTTKSYAITIERSGLAPVAGDVSVSVAANSSDNTVALALSGGPADSVTLVSSPGHGSAAVAGTSVTYTPAAGYSGNDSFTYHATNQWGTSANATVTLRITAPILNFTPVAGTLATATAGTNWTQTVAATGGSAPYIYSASGLPQGIVLNPNSGQLSGTPTKAGDYSLQIGATDSNGVTGSVRYSLAVAEQPVTGQPPIVGAVSTTVSANSRDNLISLALSGGEATAVTVIKQPVHGTAMVLGTKIRYRPVVGFVGTDSFSYRATNAYGDSQEATVTLNVESATLVLTPTSGALVNGIVGKAYTQSFSVAGGTMPYSWQINGTLPNGVVFTDGELSGIPRTATSSAFTLVATDAQGVKVRSAYTLTITAAPPQATDHSAALYAGQSVKVNLIQGAAGGPINGAKLLNQPAASMGVATIESSGSAFNLVFKAAAQASGTVTLRYVLLSSAGTSQPAQVVVQISSRPDPSKDADVIGMLSAQLQAAQNFARAQIRNFNDRLEQLHQGPSTAADFNRVRFNFPTATPEKAMTDEPSTSWQHPQPPPDDLSSSPVAQNQSVERLAFWTGGYVNFGTNKDNAVSFSHTQIGVSMGGDYRLTDDFTGGVGVGVGRDVSDIGDFGSRNNGRSVSSAFYGSYHPGAFYLDGLLGYSRLNFDSRRYVNETGVFALGSRSGRQVFSALTSGYEFRTQYSVIAPYGGVQFYRTWLDSYTETHANAFNLAFASQPFSQLTGVAGIRGQYGAPFSWGVMRLQSRIEYSQLMNDTGHARLGYADVNNDSWNLRLSSESKEDLALGMGIDFLLPYGVTPGISWQGTRGLDNENSRSQMVMLRVNVMF
ncbi:autotransporter domain-containing protein [Paramixta manurensis]|uniref:Autotransporter domain-containing protein n=1 Tax=Paramixta manurensis TaxID=2740817 RepID=A0A6M8UT75_9GAMM|nr:autotransporter domain-containing protein [Erwiniaceae bacterium PD-1]